MTIAAVPFVTNCKSRAELLSPLPCPNGSGVQGTWGNDVWEGEAGIAFDHYAFQNAARWGGLFPCGSVERVKSSTSALLTRKNLVGALLPYKTSNARARLAFDASVS